MTAEPPTSGASAQQRKSGPRLVNLGLDPTARPDTGGRHRLEDIGNLSSSWTLSTRKLNGKKSTSDDTAGVAAGSNPPGSGQPSDSNPPDNDKK